MRIKSTRAWSGAAALAVLASAAPLFMVPPAFAAGTLVGAATVNPTTGNSATSFAVTLPTGAACPGDSPNAGYRVQSYMVPASVDPGTLTFNSAGPVPAGTGAAFRQPLFAAGNPYVNAQTAAADTPGGPGTIINIPTTFNYSVFGPADIPAGAYNIGIACTLGGPSTTQMSSYWNVTKTFTTNTATGGPAQVNWSVGSIPTAPTGVAVTPGSGSLSVAFNPVTATPAVSGYIATATAGTSTFTGTGAGSPISITGLTNGTAYSVTVHATNSVGNSPESSPAVSGTPVAPPAFFGPLNQTVTVNVPAGALVFTQVCGKHNALPADSFGAAVVASTAAQESGPTTTAGGSTVDPNYPASYPSPATPTYPTWCGLSLGTASFVPGQPYAAANGVLNQVTVTDTREGDAGWKVTGTMGNLTRTPSGTISGNQLGWRPVVTEQGDYGTYNQTVTFENADPGSTAVAGHGLGTPVKLGTANAGAGLGSAQLDAKVKLLVPLNVPRGDYSGVLALSLYAAP